MSGQRHPDYLKPHGTPAAYRRHLRHGEKPCEDCRQASVRLMQDREAAGYVRPSRRKPAAVAS